MRPPTRRPRVARGAGAGARGGAARARGRARGARRRAGAARRRRQRQPDPRDAQATRTSPPHRCATSPGSALQLRGETIPGEHDRLELHAAPAVRRRRADRPVQPPADVRRGQDRRAADRRQHGRAQAVRAHVAVGAAARPSCCDGSSRRASSTSSPGSARRPATRSSPTRRAPARVHRRRRRRAARSSAARPRWPSRRSRSSSAARTRSSCSPTPTSTPPVDGALRGMNFTWQGQSCGSTSRLLVHSRARRRSSTRLAERIEALRSGMPDDGTTDTGAIVNRGQYDKVLRYLELGGTRARGSWSAAPRPTASSPAGCSSARRCSTRSARLALAQEEIFGPVLAAMPSTTTTRRCDRQRRRTTG